MSSDSVDSELLSQVLLDENGDAIGFGDDDENDDENENINSLSPPRFGGDDFLLESDSEYAQSAQSDLRADFVAETDKDGVPGTENVWREMIANGFLTPHHVPPTPPPRLGYKKTDWI